MTLPVEVLPVGSRGRRHNRPLQLTTFVGRERELAEATRRLATARLRTLVGAGGVGKTRFELRMAEDLLEGYSDRVWLIELASLVDPALVAPTIAATVGVRETAGQRLIDALVHHLHPKRLVLVLDNCEHVVHVCAELTGTLLRACPRLCMPATSRQPLGVTGEVAWRVSSLAVPDPNVASGTDEIAACDAVRLFCDRAQLVCPGLVVGDRNAASVAEVCRTLDGIPLAIEPAAARLSLLSVEQIGERLTDRFRLLVGSSRAVPPRHQTLPAVVEWSHELLPPAERRLFHRLAVFAGGWTVEAAEVVCSGLGLGSGDVLELLARLVEQSLVLADEENAGKRCYRLPETLRAYAGDELRAAGEQAHLRDPHLAWCVAPAEEVAPKLTTPEQTAWLRVLERENDNLRATLRWSLESGQIELCLRLVVACGYLWETRGHRYRAEGLGWLEQDVSPRAKWDAVIETKLTGAFRWAKHAARAMIDGGWGRQHHQHRLDLRLLRAARLRALSERQGRAARPDPGAGGRASAAPHPGQRHRAGLVHDGHDRRAAAHRPGRTDSPQDPGRPLGRAGRPGRQAWLIVKEASERAEVCVLALRASKHGPTGEAAPVHPHVFRHARVRQIVRATRNLPLAQRQAGWSRLQTAYLTVRDEEARQLMHELSD